LSSQQTARRVLEIESEQERIILVKVFGVYIGAEAHGLDKYLPERSGIHVLYVVAAKELILSLRVLLLEHLFEGFKNYEPLALVRDLWVELEDGLSVTLTLSFLSRGLLGHLETLIDAWQVHLLQRAVLVLARCGSVHEGELFVIDANCVGFIVQGLVRGGVHALSDFILLELMAIVCRHNAVFNHQRVVHVIELAGQFVFLFLTVIGLHVD